MSNTRRTGSGIIPLVPLLITESDEEFNRIRQALYDETKPNGVIEEMYVEELAENIWQILRLRRCKAGIINLAFHDSSAKILKKFMETGPDVARDWISVPKLAQKVENRLAEFKLDSSVVIADAINVKSPDLEKIDNLIVSFETRRDKVLLRVAHYRGELGYLLRNAAHQLIEGKNAELPHAAGIEKTPRPQLPSGQVLALEDASEKKKDSDS
jgi:hypothetical protein